MPDAQANYEKIQDPGASQMVLESAGLSLESQHTTMTLSKNIVKSLLQGFLLACVTHPIRL